MILAAAAAYSALAAAATPAAAIDYLVEGDSAVALEFELPDTTVYYRFFFNSIQGSMTGLDGGEDYVVDLFNAEGDFIAQATSLYNTTPRLTPPYEPPSLGGDPGMTGFRAILSAVGGSSFTFSDSYAASNIFGQYTDPGEFEVIPGGGRRLGHTPTTVAVSGVSLDPVGAIPEPSTWAMMILGFGAAGALLRRRAYAALGA